MIEIGWKCNIPKEWRGEDGEGEMSAGDYLVRDLQQWEITKVSVQMLLKAATPREPE